MVTLDPAHSWSNAKAIWANAHPMSSEELITKQAEMVYADDPGVPGFAPRVWGGCPPQSPTPHGLILNHIVTHSFDISETVFFNFWLRGFSITL